MTSPRSQSTDVGGASTPELGVFARVFPVQDAASMARTVAGHGFDCVQLNLVALGHATLPTEDELDGIDFATIKSAFDEVGVSVWGLSATYNMAHPDREARVDLTRRTAALIARAPELGATAVSLCTGTRDPENQWRAHPDNAAPEAWADMMSSFETLLTAATSAGIKLAVEPEPANIIKGTDQGVRLLADLGARGNPLGFILDPANLVAEYAADDYFTVLADAFTRLGEHTICVHAKDVVTWRQRIAGNAGLDFDRIAGLHAALPSHVPIVIQDAEPAHVDAVRDLLLEAVSKALS